MDMKQTPRRIDRRNAGMLAVLAVVLALGLAACYPGGPENLGDLGVVVTYQNPEGNFKGMMSYGMEDTVVALIDPEDDSSEPIDPQYNPWILDEIQSQMEAAGFTREMDPETNKPDVWISVGAVESEVWVYWYNWGYWGYPSWGWYYPPYVGAASFQRGTLIWQMHDLRGIDDPTDPDVKPPLNWIAAVNGALESNPNESRTRQAISQAFTQSPYIAASSAKK
jgi:hypothetical protein